MGKGSYGHVFAIANPTNTKLFALKTFNKSGVCVCVCVRERERDTKPFALKTFNKRSVCV